MTILNDKQIRALAEQGAIKNFEPHLVRKVEQSDGTVSRKISFGVTSFGYDVRLSNTGLKCFHNNRVDTRVEIDAGGQAVAVTSITEIDPKRFNPLVLWDMSVLKDEDGSEYVLLPGHSYMLGHTVERFNLPRDTVIICLGKSTYARTAISVNITPIEPEFEGQVVIEIFNHCGLPVRVYLNEGIAQFMFNKGEECETSYADRDGKYQGQSGTQLPIA